MDAPVCFCASVSLRFLASESLCADGTGCHHAAHAFSSHSAPAVGGPCFGRRGWQLAGRSPGAHCASCTGLSRDRVDECACSRVRVDPGFVSLGAAAVCPFDQHRIVRLDVCQRPRVPTGERGAGGAVAAQNSAKSGALGAITRDFTPESLWLDPRHVARQSDSVRRDWLGAVDP